MRDRVEREQKPLGGKRGGRGGGERGRERGEGGGGGGERGRIFRSGDRGVLRKHGGRIGRSREVFFENSLNRAPHPVAGKRPGALHCFKNGNDDLGTLTGEFRPGFGSLSVAGTFGANFGNLVEWRGPHSSVEIGSREDCHGE